MENQNENAVQAAKEFKGLHKGFFSLDRELYGIVRDMYPKKCRKERMPYHYVLIMMYNDAWYGDEPYQIIHKVYNKAAIYGLNKGELEFSLDYFCDVTGLSNQELRTFVQKLIEKGLIYVVKSGKGETPIYRLQQCTNITDNNTSNNIECSNGNTSEGANNNISNKHTSNKYFCNKILFKDEYKDESFRGVPSEGTSPSSGSDSCESQMRVNENQILNSNLRNENPSTSGEDSRKREPSLDSLKKLSSNLRIKNVSPDELIFFCNSKILNKSLGKDEENRIRELFTQYAPTNQESTLVSFALKLLNELNKEFALKFKKKYASEIASGKKNPFTVNDALQQLYGHYSEKSVAEHKKEIENFYARLELQGFISHQSGNEVSLMGFVAWLDKNIQFRTREQEAPFTKEDLKKALPYEDEKVMERLESKYDRYFKRGNWTTKNGNDVTLEMFTGFFRKTVIEELKEEGYVPKENKKISRDGRKYFEVEDIPELLKKFSGR